MLPLDRGRALERMIAKMLPTIRIGAFDFYDITGIVQPDRARAAISDTIGVAFHHTVGQTSFPDRNFNGSNMDEEIAHIKAIDEYHVAKGYGGFGYNGIVFESGRVYVVNDCMGVRAHVAHRNHVLRGLAWAGTFSVADPPTGVVLGAAQWYLAMVEQHGRLLAARGHRDWVLPEHKPEWSTSCPGDVGVTWIPRVVASSGELIKERIRNATKDAWFDADVDTLARQLAFITRGRLCAA